MQITYDEMLKEENSHVVNHVEYEPPPEPQPQAKPQPHPKPKPQPKHSREPLITFDHSETIKALDGPPYIVARVARNPPYGFHVDPTSMVDVIIEENLFHEHL